jgi:hypothetical protein
MGKAMKSGCWLAGIYFVIALIALVVTQFSSQEVADVIAWIMFGLSLPAMGLLSLIMGANNFIVHATTSAFIGVVLISASLYFLIGALVGWLLEKKNSVKKKR